MSEAEGKKLAGGVLLARAAAIAQHFGIERADEGLDPVVVIRVGSSGHALLYASGAQPLAKDVASILAAAVATNLNSSNCRVRVYQAQLVPRP